MLSGKWRPFCLGLNVLMKFVQAIIGTNAYMQLSLVA